MFIYTTLQPLLFTGITTKGCYDCNLYSKPYTLLLDCLHFTIVNRVMITNILAIWYTKITSVNIWNYLESLSYSATMNKEKQGGSNPPKRARIAYLRLEYRKRRKSQGFAIKNGQNTTYHTRLQLFTHKNPL